MYVIVLEYGVRMQTLFDITLWTYIFVLFISDLMMLFTRDVLMRSNFVYVPLLDYSHF